MTDEEARAGVKRLFELLETKEESDSGRVFHPTTINSCRALVVNELRDLLPSLKEWANQ